MLDAVIIGAGVTGSAIARELSRHNGRFCVVEKEGDVCSGTSKANSAIVHAGFDAEPGSNKAIFNVRGSEMMEDLWNVLYEHGSENYQQICERFDSTYGCDSPYAQRWQEIGEQLMIFFVYTYFCGAVYDEWIAGKIRLAAFSVRWIQELVRYNWVKNGETLSMEDVIRMSWYYAREVEHSDDNLSVLDQWLEGECQEETEGDDAEEHSYEA